jgi:hypothetical protein
MKPVYRETTMGDETLMCAERDTVTYDLDDLDSIECDGCSLVVSS